MSFILAHFQRSSNPVSELSATSQLTSHPTLSSPMPLPPFDPVLPFNSQSSNLNGSQGHNHADESLPQVGQTRCYWALLSSELDFLYLDPVLQSHLDAQAELLVGKSLLGFVHPDEQASAKQDLGSVLESRHLHGSVTRVRYSRLSRIRRELGYQGTQPSWPGEDKIGVDSNYMAVDIVINWAAEGLVLCFIHAVVDINPVDDNNEELKNGWSNWCGTPSMNSHQAQLLYRHLRDNIPVPGDMGRVFQILLNRPDRPLWMSWPPDPSHGSAEGRATSKDFAKLAEEVQISNNGNGSDAKTTCTRRYKASQSICMGPEGSKDVESIFIPHGSIIFACHKVDLSHYSRPTPRNGHTTGYANSSYVPQSQHFYDAPPHTHPYGLPPLATSPGFNYLPQTSAPQTIGPHLSPHDQWPPGSATNAPGHYGNEWPASVSSSTSHIRSGMYVPSQSNQHQWPSHPPSYNIDPSQSGQQRSISPYNYSQTIGDANASDAGSASSEVPPPRSAQRRGAARDQYGSGGRSTGKPPVGINRCSSCKVTQSPEWRKGPSGKKDLCNACGLRYARSRAKKEGVTSSRRRKDKLFALSSKQDAPQHAGQPGSSSGARRSIYSDESFFSPSAAHSESYSSHTLNTPSPPPPQSRMNFVHYSHQNQPQDQHSHIDSRASQYSYPISSSLLDPTPLQHQSSPRGNVTSLPRLAPVSFSANRLPQSSSASPSSAGPPTHASSFERDSSSLRPKDRIKRERDHAHSPVNLPSTPMSTSSEWSRKSTSFVS